MDLCSPVDSSHFECFCPTTVCQTSSIQFSWTTASGTKSNRRTEVYNRPAMSVIELVTSWRTLSPPTTALGSATATGSRKTRWISATPTTSNTAAENRSSRDSAILRRNSGIAGVPEEVAKATHAPTTSAALPTANALPIIVMERSGTDRDRSTIARRSRSSHWYRLMAPTSTVRNAERMTVQRYPLVDRYCFAILPAAIDAQVIATIKPA